MRFAGELLAFDDSKPLLIAEGGATRTDSVRAGLLEVPDSATVIAVHDGARPLFARHARADHLHVHAARRQLGEIAVRVDVLALSEERIARQAEIRETESRREIELEVFNRLLFRFGLQSLNEAQRRVLRSPHTLREGFLDDPRDLFLTLNGLRIGRGIDDWIAFRLQRSKFDVKKIVLTQVIDHLLRFPAEQLQQLVIGEKVPVSPDDSRR